MAWHGHRRRLGAHVNSQIPRNGAVIPCGPLQLNHLAQSVVQDDAVQDDDDDDWQESDARGEENEFGGRQPNEPAPAPFSGVSAPPECRQKANHNA